MTRARFLIGEKDTALLTGNLNGLDAYVKNLTVRRVPDGTHWVIHEKTAEVRRVGDTAAASHGTVKRDRAHDENEVLRGNGKQKVQIDRSVRKGEPVRQQQAVDRAGRANDVRLVELIGELERQQREEGREDARAHPGHEVELQEIARTPGALELGAEHPEREHVEEDVEETQVDKRRGEEAPNLAAPNLG